ncbi:MAG: 4-hydroxy-tetrahydrodipicolinate reductase [bacterium]|nr:4-hydroxy-tetrahydrodipicolinate reductase [bacterium]
MTETIRVIVNGAKGRMGSEAVKAVEGASDMQLAAALDMGDDLKQAIEKEKPAVVIDFTTPNSAFDNTMLIIESQAGGVIGTTGFTTEQIHQLRKKAEFKKPGVIIAPNFSIGAILMMHCAHIVAHHMPHVEIVEMHHPAKLDSPSGTSIKTADMLAHAVKDTVVPRGTDEEPARGLVHENIPIHSIRLPGYLAHQEVIFGADGQTLTIRHDTYNRTCYMPGVLMAVREAVKRPGLTYGLENILFPG